MGGEYSIRNGIALPAFILYSEESDILDGGEILIAAAIHDPGEGGEKNVMKASGGRGTKIRISRIYQSIQTTDKPSPHAPLTFQPMHEPFSFA